MYNLQGDVIALVNSAGTKVVEYTYDGWGKTISKTGTLASALGTLNPFRYRGYVYDEEIDFYYLRSRYYNANRGRFINADSVFDSINLFNYCENTPVNRVDENGCSSIIPAGILLYEALKFGTELAVGIVGFVAALDIGIHIGKSQKTNSPGIFDREQTKPVPVPGPAPVSTPVPQIYETSTSVTATTTVLDLDQTEVGEKEKRIPQYWAAYRNTLSGFVIAGFPLSYSEALNRVMEGRDVLAIHQGAAYALVKYSGNYVGPEKHHGIKGYYLYHYHVRHSSGHVFFLGGIIY